MVYIEGANPEQALVAGWPEGQTAPAAMTRGVECRLQRYIRDVQRGKGKPMLQRKCGRCNLQVIGEMVTIPPSSE